MKTVYVWSLPTRLFHWLLVLFIVAAYLSADEEAWLERHAAFGVAAGILMLYRLLWGVMGPDYSRFRDFNMSLSSLKNYLLTLFAQEKHYVGHNPAASFAMIGIITVTLLLALSGLLTYGIQENRGLFAFLHGSFFRDMELFEAVHETLSTLLLILIGAHVGGVMLERTMHPEADTLGSIFSGRKRIEGRNVKLTAVQKAVSFIGITLSLAVLVYMLALKENPLTASHHTATDYKSAHPLFVKECASCHILYPPSLLPERSWQAMMAGLENHFGDDASLDAADNRSIAEYLAANAAEHSTAEASVKILHSMPNQAIIAITQTPFWKTTHQAINARIFKHAAVKSRANCKACHSDVERGLIEDTAIKMPDIRS